MLVVKARESLLGRVLGSRWGLGGAALLAAVPVLQPLPATSSLLRLPAALGAVEAQAARRAARAMALWASGGHRVAQVPSSATASSPSSRAGNLGSATPWTSLAPGVRCRTVPVQPGVRMQQILVERRQLRIVTARSLGSEAAAVPELARRARLVAAVNACYFDEKREPLGYLKVAGRVLRSGVATGAAFTGVFTLEGGVARILPRESFRPERADTALQAGPRLVAGGRPTEGLRETRSFRQTGVGVTRSGQVLLYATDGLYSGLTWQATRKVLLGPATRGGVDVTDVLNLDGGSSSQLYQAPPAALTTGFPTRVPVVLGARRAP